MPDSTLNTAYLNRCMDQWQAGDLEGRERLIRVAGARLEPLARKMLKDYPTIRNLEETADVLQNALLRLLRTLEELRPASTRDFFRLAALQIRRELLDLARHHQCRVRSIAMEDSRSIDPIAQAPEQVPLTADLDRWCAFHQSVEELPVEEREVVGLIFYHEWSQAQVAELFDVSVRTVRRRWEQAMAKLHVLIGQSDVSSRTG